MARIFISYKRIDKDKVIKIKDRIESATHEECWMDITGIESDAQFKNVIINAIKSAEIFLFMYSKAHSEIVDFENDWTIRELNFAKSKKKRIVFINIDGSELTDVFTFDFGTKQQVNAKSDDQMEMLIADIHKWLSLDTKDISLHSTTFNHHERQHWILWTCCAMIAVMIATYFFAKDYSAFNQKQQIEIKDNSTSLQGVDLGLPSGTLWANMNYGAKSKQNSGNFISAPIGITYENEGDWQIPSEIDFKELITTCNWIWTEIDGCSGFRIEGKNGNWIFLPAAGWLNMDGETEHSNQYGYYWTSDRHSDKYVRTLLFSKNERRTGNGDVHIRRPIRKVLKPTISLPH